MTVYNTAESTRASMEITKMPNLRYGNKGGGDPGSLDSESSILPLSYRGPLLHLNEHIFVWKYYCYDLLVYNMCYPVMQVEFIHSFIG